MDGFNRVFLTVLGLLLVAGAGTGLAVAAGLIPEPDTGTALEQVTTTVQQQPGVWWPVILLGAGLLLLVGLWLVRRQIPDPGTSTPNRITLARQERGRTTLNLKAVAAAADSELRRLHGVTASRSTLVRLRPEPLLATRLDVGSQADLDAVRRDAEHVFERVSQALGVDDIAADIRLRPTSAEPTRVR